MAGGIGRWIRTGEKRDRTGQEGAGDAKGGWWWCGTRRGWSELDLRRRGRRESKQRE